MLRRQIDENWYQGELNGQIGVFPASYVQVRNKIINLVHNTYLGQKEVSFFRIWQ